MPDGSMPTTQKAFPWPEGRSLRVLHIGKYYPPAPGGIEAYMGDLCLGLAGAGVPNYVLAHKFESDEPTCSEPSSGVSVERVPVAASFCYSLIAPLYPLRLYRAVNRFKPSVIHAHLPNLSAFSCLLPGLSVPLVLHWHADVAWPEDKRLARALYHGYAPAESMLLRRADRVVATSKAYLDGSRALSRIRDKCSVVPLGVREERLHKPDSSTIKSVRSRWLGPDAGGRMLVVSAGRFSHYKGFEHLVRAMRAVPDAVCVMVGDGETHGAMEVLVRNENLQDRVHLAGRLQDPEMHALMAACDVFCLPSIERSEAFGVVLVEAMALGACCVSTNIQGSAPGWVVEDGHTGLVVPPGDEDALARTLNQLAADSGARLRFAEAGRRRYEKLFKLESTLPSLLRVYEEAVSGH